MRIGKLSTGKLRPCIVYFPQETEFSRRADEDCGTMRVIRKAEERKGYFHTWGINFDGKSCGIVEFDDGAVCRVLPEYITFADRSEE